MYSAVCRKKESWPPDSTGRMAVTLKKSLCNNPACAAGIAQCSNVSPSAILCQGKRAKVLVMKQVKKYFGCVMGTHDGVIPYNVWRCHRTVNALKTAYYAADQLVHLQMCACSNIVSHATWCTVAR